MTAAVDNDAACCQIGSEWEGEPAGEVTKFAGLDAYVAKASSPTTRAVIMIPDIHGWELKNARLVADAFAKSGFFTVLADYFHNDPFPINNPESGGQWFERNPVDFGGRTERETRAVIAELRSAHGIKSVGVQGFCWGGFHAVHLTSLGDEIQTAIIAHGSRLTQDMIERIAKPVLFVCPEIDAQIPDDFRHAIEKELAKKTFPTRVDLYPGQQHGFTLRPQLKGDTSDEALLKASDEALRKSIAWFAEHLDT